MIFGKLTVWCLREPCESVVNEIKSVKIRVTGVEITGRNCLHSLHIRRENIPVFSAIYGELPFYTDFVPGNICGEKKIGEVMENLLLNTNFSNPVYVITFPSRGTVLAEIFSKFCLDPARSLMSYVLMSDNDKQQTSFFSMFEHIAEMHGSGQDIRIQDEISILPETYSSVVISPHEQLMLHTVMFDDDMWEDIPYMKSSHEFINTIENIKAFMSGWFSNLADPAK